MWESKKITDKQLISQLEEIAIDNYGICELSNRDFLNWQYYENPFGEPVIRVAVDNSEIVGQYIIIPVLYNMDGEDVYLGFDINTITKKSHRGQGIFKNLAWDSFKDCENKKINYAIGYPNPSSYPGYKKYTNYEMIGDVPLYLKVFKGKKLLENIGKKYLSSIGYVYDYLTHNKKIDKLNFKNIFEINKDNVELMNKFYLKIKNKYKNLCVKDASYVTWRFLNCPTRDYKVLAYIEDEEVQGYIVVRIYNQILNSNSGMIVDFLFKTDRKDVGDSLIKYIIKYFKENDCELSGCLMLDHTEEVTILKKNGYFKCPKQLEPQPFHFIFKKNSEEEVSEKEKGYYDISNWFLTMSDNDPI